MQDFLVSVEKKDRQDLFTQVDRLQEDGIDLYNFAKQLLQYIDKHLMENIDGYLAISQSCSEILSTIRYYPYPAIVYKIAFNKLLVGPQTEQAQPAMKQPENRVKEIKEIEIKPEPVQINDTPKQVEQQEASMPTNDNAVQEESTPTPTEKSNNTNNYDDVKNQLLAKIDKQSLKDNLTDNIYIQSFENNTVNMITISSMGNMLLQKQDTIQYLEKLLAEIYGNPVALSVKFIKKEDFLQSMM